MGRNKGSSNKKILPALQLNEEERIQLLANLIIEILSEEEAPTLESEKL